jgi:hypothetical protein
MAPAVSLAKYFERFDQGDTSLPSKDILTTLSKKLDASAQKAFKKIYDASLSDAETVKKVKELELAPRLVGKYSASKVVLKESSPFEQMVVLKSYLDTHNITQQHTYFFANGSDDYIPIRVKTGSLMHTILGTTKGDHRAPDYKEWAKKDPWQDKSQTRFIYPLEALEMIRQSNFVAATVLKGNAFESEYIDETWRYGLEFACVENGGQSKDTPKKTKSAALNLCQLVDVFSDQSDTFADELNICVPICYENYSTSGYDDDHKFEISPGKIMKATKEAFVLENDTELDKLMLQLAIAKIGKPKTESLKKMVVKELFPNKK